MAKQRHVNPGVYGAPGALLAPGAPERSTTPAGLPETRRDQPRDTLRELCGRTGESGPDENLAHRR
ncbi:hypothetical protein [Nocardia jejuensis]|uniref:hypothetical protein n=1 Tax=Nocardia jejuensis TaxID=328049 RepID=UPI000B19E2CD|nr:hypothetical protein [Nocardia jejuensis]